MSTSSTAYDFIKIDILFKFFSFDSDIWLCSSEISPIDGTELDILFLFA